MEEFEYHTFFRQLNEEQKLIFDDVMHENQLYLNIFILNFLTRVAVIGKTFNSRIIMILQ
jgi:cell division protein FtsL